MRMSLPGRLAGLCFAGLAWGGLGSAARGASGSAFPQARIAAVGGAVADEGLLMFEETRKAIRASHDYDDIQLHEQGVVLQSRGGRFETVSEIRMFRQWGADVVTMNIGTEMAYARMMGINYAALVSISNPAEGVGD